MHVDHAVPNAKSNVNFKGALACHGLTPSVDYERLRLPEPARCAKFTLVELVAEAGFEPTTQRL